MRFRAVALTLLAVSCLAVGAHAQRLQTLDVPDEVEGELDGEQTDYELSVSETTLVKVSLHSDDFDPYLELLDVEGVTVAENDDGGDDNGSLLNFVAEADTEYTIRVRSYSTGANGDFTLVVGSQETSEISLEQSGATNLEGQSAFFTFEGKGGDEVDFVVEAESYDTILTLMDAYGNKITSSDDEGEGVNPFISDFVVPADGIYILHLTAYPTEPSEEPIEVIVRPTTIQDITLDEPLTSEQDRSFLRFEAEEGTTYRIEVRSTEPASFNVEIKPQTSETSQVSVSGFGPNMLAFEFAPTADGVYKLTISGISTDFETMPYTTTLSEAK